MTTLLIALIPNGTCELSKLMPLDQSYFPIWEKDEPVKLIFSELWENDGPVERPLVQVNGLLIPGDCLVALTDGTFLRADLLEVDHKLQLWEAETGRPTELVVAHVPLPTSLVEDVFISGPVVFGPANGPWIAGRF